MFLIKYNPATTLHKKTTLSQRQPNLRRQLVSDKQPVLHLNRESTNFITCAAQLVTDKTARPSP